MAQRTQIILISDISGDEIVDGGETVQFSYRGTDYEIDLTDKEAAAFDDAIALYLGHARRASRRRSAARGSSAPARADRSELEKIREWGRANGFKVSERGRISQDLQDAYHSANR